MVVGWAPWEGEVGGGFAVLLVVVMWRLLMSGVLAPQSQQAQAGSTVMVVTRVVCAVLLFGGQSTLKHGPIPDLHPHTWESGTVTTVKQGGDVFELPLTLALDRSSNACFPTV